MKTIDIYHPNEWFYVLYVNGNDKDIKSIYKHKHELEDAMNYWQEDNFANWYLSVKKNINIDIFREFMCREI